MLKGYKIKKGKNDFLDPEEILLDSQIHQKAEDDFLAGQKIEKPLTKKTTIFFISILAVVFGLILTRVFWLQLIEGEKYKAMAQDNQLHAVPIPGPRGLIYDKNGVVLAQNKATYDVLINFSLLGDTEEVRQNKIEGLKNIIGYLPQDLSESDIGVFLKIPPSQNIVFRSNFDHQQMLALQSNLTGLEGIFIEESSLRDYPVGSSMAHVLGYLGQINEEEKDKYSNYFLIEKVGKSGLEAWYESVLRGEPGVKKYLSNSLLQKNDLPIEEEGVPGYNLLLNIDSQLQKKVFDSLNKYYTRLKTNSKGISGAAAVVLNPQNGGVLALVSLPAFNGNDIMGGLSQDEFKNLFQNSEKPLFNRVIAGQYPTGSIIKPIVAAAALQEEIISPEKRVDDMGGVLALANPYSPGVVYYFRDWAVHGVVDLYSAIAKSCNIYFYMLGGGYQDQEGLGIERIIKYFKGFGLGSRNNIDLPGEKPGLVPSPEWKEEVKGESWYIGDTYHISIGQGDFLATPLQMATAISAIANGGLIYQPQVVDKIIDMNDNVVNDISPQTIISKPVQENYLAEVRRGMRQAVQEGSAVSLSSLPVEVAGKTGTAQLGGTKQTHAWFAGFAPFQNPEMVIVVLVEGGGEGHAAAVPVAKEIIDWYFSNK